MAEIFTTLWSYPWDLADEGFEEAINGLKQETDLDAISLAAAYHSFEMLRPRSPGRVQLQIPKAAVYYQPRQDLYRDTPIAPHVSPLMGSADWYGAASEACARAGLGLVAWTVFLHNSTQAHRHPDCAEVACTGDISTSRLCPANPSVRAYATAVARNLSQSYDTALLECESLSYGGFGHTHYHVKHGVDLGQGGRFLLSLCFCHACRAEARTRGVDPDPIAAAGERILRDALAEGRTIDRSPEDLTDSIPGLSGYVAMREDVVTTLTEEVREAAKVPISVIFMGDPLASDLNRKRIAAVADYAEILSYTADPAGTQANIDRVVPDLREPAQLLLGLQAYPPASRGPGDLLANIDCAYNRGIRRYSFYNFGIMPKPNLAWVQTAVADVRNRKS